MTALMIVNNNGCGMKLAFSFIQNISLYNLNNNYEKKKKKKKRRWFDGVVFSNG